MFTTDNRTGYEETAMKDRGNRRNCEKKHKDKLYRLSLHSVSAERIVIDEDGKRRIVPTYGEGNSEKPDYVREVHRLSRSKKIKKLYSKRFRNGSKKMEGFKGSEYKKMSGDFVYDYE